MLKKLDNFLKNLPIILFIITMFIINYCIARMNLFVFLPDNNGARHVFISKYNQFLESVIIAPFFETLIYQKVLISLCCTWSELRKRKYLIVIISSFIFSLNHTYSPQYAVETFFSGGMIFAYSYLVYKDKTKYSFWIVFSIHATWNLFIMIYN
ncbi:CPBP family intramembrane glutamic endopeptidase [Tepidibacter aestuarii]|uniref:CPBP family intramembrane glutamic endopeptidase n=1 Tax=Tepidibacter aestuarii TaxID=2925782 RepID=UPI0020C08573|nr:CPBP family intramembrane glutamic endopeptidase [Tepidibacter aestuarii]CAH2213101.1 CAAX protease self-immunity [Tepidibacter aestuarii]